MRSLKVTNLICVFTTLASSLASSVDASSADPALCGKACRQTFRTLKFADAPEGSFFAKQECISLAYQTSLHLCWDAHCTEDVWLRESRVMNQTCQDTYGLYLAPHDIIDDITDKQRAQIIIFDATDPNRHHRYGALMLPSQAYYDIWTRTLVSSLNMVTESLNMRLNTDADCTRLYLGLSLLLWLGYGDLLGRGHDRRHRESNFQLTIHRTRSWGSVAQA